MNRKKTHTLSLICRDRPKVSINLATLFEFEGVVEVHFQIHARGVEKLERENTKKGSGSGDQGY